MRYFKNCLLIVMLGGVLGCMTTREKMAGVQMGMTKDEVIAVMGPPKVTTTTANSDVEILRYKRYFIRMKDGKVDAYGDVVDYDLSTRQ